MVSFGLGLVAEHAQKLAASKVAPEVAHERGYRSITEPAQMRHHGFRGEQAKLYPSLLVPLHNVWGENAGYQIRPDDPRTVRGRLAKYETRAGERMVIDCHPRVRPVLGDPSIPLLITEGPIKGDAVVTAGGFALALLGVWNFRGKNDLGSTVNLPEIGEIAWEGRKVLVCFDSDVMGKSQVHQACATLGALLARRGADVAYVYLPSVGLSKVGVDDWLSDGNQLGDLWGLASPELRRLEDPSAAETADTYDDIPDEDGADVLDDVRGFLTAHLIFTSEHQATAVTLWAAHTYGLDVFDSSPRLCIYSPQKQTGKTRLLELLELLCWYTRRSSNLSASYLFRMVELHRPTLLIDELDTIFRAGDTSHEDLRGLINAGHRRDAVVGRVEGDGANRQPKEFAVFCPVATAGIGSPHETIADRGVPIRLRRRARGEKVIPFRQRRTVPIGKQLGRRLAAWMQRNLETLAGAEPEMPDGIEDRAADVWEPLLAIADAAGGDWVKEARAAAQLLNKERADHDDNLDISLLADLRTLMTGRTFATRDRFGSRELCDALNRLEDSPWKAMRNEYGIDPRTLADRLRAYDIKPTNLRIGGDVVKGYSLSQFSETWDRYLPPPHEDDKGEEA